MGLPAFKPGQYSVLGLAASATRCADAEPEDPPPAPDAFIRRAYSIASSSMEREYLEFYIAHVKSGVRARLFSLKSETGSGFHPRPRDSSPWNRYPRTRTSCSSALARDWLPI